MSWSSVAASRLRGLFHRDHLESRLDDEIRFHVEMQTEDNVRAGLDPIEARYAALRSFGAVESMKERHRERRAVPLVDSMKQDIRYAIRTLRRDYGFSLTSIVVLGLAIGANTAMFSVLNAVLFRPLPLRAPEQLAMLWSEIPSQNVREGRTALYHAEQWRLQSKSFQDMAVWDPVSATLSSGTGAQQVSVSRVSSNFFDLLGIHPAHGRFFTAAEATERQRLAVISHSFWQTRLGGASNVIGSTIEIDGAQSQVIGVLPASFHLSLFDSDIWEPASLFPDWEARRGVLGPSSWFVLGRLRPDVTLQQAQSEMTAIAHRLDEELPAAQRNRGISIVTLSDQVTGTRSRLALWLLSGAILCVLLIAATNVASLSLARSAGRDREIAIRSALGAGRGRIIRQLLVESLTLAVIAGLFGLLIAHSAVRLIALVNPGNLARIDEISLDPLVLAWTMGLCLLTGILVGLAPALSAVRKDLRTSVQEGGRSNSGGVASRRIRSLLVSFEFALAIVLLSGAGLLVRSLWSVENVKAGFNTDRVLIAQLSTAEFKTDVQRVNFYNQAVQEVTSQPGVESAGLIGNFFFGGNPERVLTLEGEVRSVSERLRFRVEEVSDGFFQTLGTPLLQGRFFSPADRFDSPRVAIINETMARRLWPATEPLGRRFKLGPTESQNVWYTVVGVVGDMHRQGLEREVIPQMFEPLAQNPGSHCALLVRTSVDDPLKMTPTIEAAVHRVSKQVPVYHVSTLEQQLSAFLTPRRFQTSLLIGFSIVALLIAAIGIYGLIRYSVATRTNEIGIRLAIGAKPGTILRMILREGLTLAAAGLLPGLVGALWLGQAGASLLSGVKASDPLTFVSVSLLLICVAAAACYFPARRAMKVEPMTALRQE